MALMCPVNHPPGVGTTFCRLCGRTYVEVEDAPAPAALALLGAGPVARVETPEPFSLPLQPVPVQARPVPAQPAPGAALPPSSGYTDVSPRETSVEPAAPVPLPAPPVAVAPGVQVHLPLLEAPAAPDQDPPDQDPPGPVRRQLDRTAVLAGVLGGFVGGAVSGAAVALLLG